MGIVIDIQNINTRINFKFSIQHIQGMYSFNWYITFNCYTKRFIKGLKILNRLPIHFCQYVLKLNGKRYRMNDVLTCRNAGRPFYYLDIITSYLFTNIEILHLEINHTSQRLLTNGNQKYTKTSIKDNY